MNASIAGAPQGAADPTRRVPAETRTDPPRRGRDAAGPGRRRAGPVVIRASREVRGAVPVPAGARSLAVRGPEARGRRARLLPPRPPRFPAVFDAP
jgi:hypothetical protein